MKISRKFAMPTSHTFDMLPVQEILNKYGAGKNWIDPFVGWSDVAELTNDINPRCPAHSHMDALKFLCKQKTNFYVGCLLDPPYSLRQLKECYSNLGKSLSQEQSRTFWSKIKEEIKRIIKPSGIVISFGWNSIGLGKNRGFKILEILLVYHGGFHNDTIVVIEKKL